MNTAANTLKKLYFSITDINSYSNSDLDEHDIRIQLNNECMFLQELCGQDTWSFCDGSYITRIQDDYYPGDDIRDFELTHSINEELE